MSNNTNNTIKIVKYISIAIISLGLSIGGMVMMFLEGSENKERGVWLISSGIALITSSMAIVNSSITKKKIKSSLHGVKNDLHSDILKTIKSTKKPDDVTIVEI